MKKRRIPPQLGLFITYILNVNVYLNTVAPGDIPIRGLVLGISQAELDALQVFELLFMSGDPLHPGIWDLHSNADTKNKKTRADMIIGMKDFGLFFRPVLNKVNISPLIAAGDRLKLNIAAPVTSHRAPTNPIIENCFVSLSTQIGCILHFRCKKTADDSRASKPENADGVEIAYRSDLPELEPPVVPGQPPTKVKRNLLIDENDGTTKVVYTKADFKLQLPTAEKGNYFQFFVRWVNTRHPNLAGPWTGPSNCSIS